MVHLGQSQAGVAVRRSWRLGAGGKQGDRLNHAKSDALRILCGGRSAHPAAARPTVRGQDGERRSRPVFMAGSDAEKIRESSLNWGIHVVLKVGW